MHGCYGRCFRRCIFAGLLLLVHGAGAAWPQFRGPNRDGKAAPGPALMRAWPDDGPRMVWAFDGLGIGHASVAVTADAVYTTGMEGDEGFVYALDHEGRLRWKSSYGRDWDRSYRGSRTTPTVHRGRIYVLSGYGRAVCFDAETGREIWAVDTVERFGARNIQWGITESLLAWEDRVFVSPGGPRAGLVALDAETGRTLWACGDVDDVSGYCSPILVEHGGRRIIVQLMGTTFVGVDASDGTLLWREVREPRPAHDIQAVSPVYEDGRIYITSGYGGQRGEMFRLGEDGTSVIRAWRDADLDCQLGGLVVLDGRIYGASDRNHRNRWVCLDFQTGRVVGIIPGVGKGSVIYADGLLYTLGENSTMGLVNPDPADFRLINSFRVPSGGGGPHWSHPAIADGRLYVRHGATLVVYDLRAP